MQATHQLQQQVHVRTIFDPESVKTYEALSPGAASRLLAVLEANNASEREARSSAIRLEHTVILAQIKDNKRRDWMAFLLIGMSLGASGVFAYLNMPWLSGGAFASMILYVALGFFKWRKNTPFNAVE